MNVLFGGERVKINCFARPSLERTLLKLKLPIQPKFEIKYGQVSHRLTGVVKCCKELGEI